MSDAVAVRRQLKIKSGVVKRLSKEIGLYTKEVEQNRIKVEKFKADGAEDWDIKNGVRTYQSVSSCPLTLWQRKTRLIDESQRMVRDSQDRLGKATEELRVLVNSAERVDGLEGEEELAEARETLEAASI
ncbi:tubulin binding cofactor A, partial [Auriscalpium vulgare]